MASDRTRELARKYLIRRDSRFERESYMPDAFDELAALLDAFERETRLDEAKWWAGKTAGHERSCSFNSTDGPLGDYCNCSLLSRKQRIVELAAQPTPEVKR